MEDPKNARDENGSKLVRGLSLVDAIAIVVGSMIGSGVFLVSAESSRLVGSPGWLMVVWLLAGIMTITGALCLGEVAAMMPRAGGPYVFLREAYSPGVGFLFGWAQFLVVQTGTIAAVAVAFANFSGVLVPSITDRNFIVAPVVFGSYAVSLSTQQLVAIVIIVILTIVNTRGLEMGKLIQRSFTFTKTFALFALVVIGLFVGWNSLGAVFTSDWWHPSANGWDLIKAQPAAAMAGSVAFFLVIGRAMTGPLFSQSAWNNVTFTAGEVEDPGRNLPRALLIGCVIVVSLYILANLAYVVTLPLVEIQAAPQNRVGTALMEHIFGPAGAIVMAAAIMISTFGCNNGLIFAGARVYFAMARDRLFFARLGSTNKFHVPAVALVAQCVWASLLVLPRTVTYDAVDPSKPLLGNVYTQLLEYIVSVELVFGALAVLAVIVLRYRKPDIPRPYRTWGYPAVPIIFIVLSILLIVDLAILAPATSGVGYLLALTGIPVYLIWRHRTRV
ncbi:MAG: amino acid permease [Acidobacteriota bacterium]